MTKEGSLTKEEFRTKELDILRAAVEKAENEQALATASAPEVKEIIKIVEKFLIAKKLICYGGTAINNILPESDQFYDKSTEIPDYDFFSPNALSDAKELADIYANKGYAEVEAKAGQHFGTFKVFVNYIPVADITQTEPELFKRLSKDVVIVDKIRYSPVNLLRMNMYLELSRPAGMVGRWEKVLKRLILLNKNYPLRGERCSDISFQRSFEDTDKSVIKNIYSHLRKVFIQEGAVFFGGYANSLYSKYMKNSRNAHLPDFDVLSETPEKTADSVIEALTNEGIENVSYVKHDGIGEMLAEHFEIKVGNETVAFIYLPLSCHSYNEIRIGKYNVKVATIDTMLNLYLSFLFADRKYYDEERILCMAEYLFKVQAKNRLAQKGLLKRFSLQCYGKQETLDDMRKHKAAAYKRLKDKRGTKEYEEHFLKYVPKKAEALKRLSSTKKVSSAKSSSKKTRKNK